MTVAGCLLTLFGSVVVLVTRDDPQPSRDQGPTQPVSATEAESITVTTAAGPLATNQPAGPPGPQAQPGSPAPSPGSPTAPPPATPQEVAELLAGLPLQLEQAATAGGEPRELTEDEVRKIVEDVMRQIGALP